MSLKKCVSVYSLSKRIKFSKPHLDGNYPSKELSKPVIKCEIRNYSGPAILREGLISKNSSILYFDNQQTVKEFS